LKLAPCIYETTRSLRLNAAIEASFRRCGRVARAPRGEPWSAATAKRKKNAVAKKAANQYIHMPDIKNFTFRLNLDLNESIVLWGSEQLKLGGHFMRKIWGGILYIGLTLAGCGGGGGSSSATTTPTSTAEGPSINVTLIDQPVLGSWAPTTAGNVDLSASGVSFTFSRPTTARSDAGSRSGPSVSTAETTYSTWYKTDLEIKDAKRNCSTKYSVVVSWDKKSTTPAVDAGDGTITGSTTSSTCPPSRFPQFIAWAARFTPDQQKQIARLLLVMSRADAQQLVEGMIYGLPGDSLAENIEVYLDQYAVPSYALPGPG
jgi:hypothetical protein